MTTHPTDPSHQRRLAITNLRTTRLGAFSDGVFAIAITLLDLRPRTSPTSRAS